MSSPLTDPIKEGQDFTQFIMRCARYMPELSPMGQQPLDVPVPDFFTTPQHHKEQADALEARLAELEALDDNQAEAEATREYAALQVAHLAGIEQAKALLLKFNGMLNHVQAWTPPTKEHEPLKQFMVHLLVEAISSECDPSRWDLKIKRPEGPAWRDAQVMECRRQIEYHRKEQVAEHQRTQERNDWLKALRASL